MVLLLPYLDADHGVHVEASKLPRLNHRDADLVVLGLQGVLPRASRFGPEIEYRFNEDEHFKI